MKGNGIICFGELMIRLSTIGVEKIVQANHFEIKFTGAEANVGVSCVNYGTPAFVVSMVPDNDIGQACINYLRRYGLNTDYIFKDGERLGILYTETGHSQRPSKVVYDRFNSSFSKITITENQWESILEGKNWFHFCGTAPAQGKHAFDTLVSGLRVAKEMGLTVSVDYNYRHKLWTKDQAKRSMEQLMEYVDVGIGNEEDCYAMFGVKAEDSDFETGIINHDSYASVAKQMVNKYDLRCQAITLRESISANKNGWSALVHDGKMCFRSKHYMVDIIDRIGGGDSFTGAFVFSLISGSSYQEAIDFAAAASCLKQTILGDFNLVSKDDVLALVQGDSSGRVQR